MAQNRRETNVVRIRLLFLVAMLLVVGIVAIVTRIPKNESVVEVKLAQVQNYSNGLYWDVKAPAIFAQGDSYIFQGTVRAEPKPIDREFTLMSGGVVVELWQPNGGFRTHDLFRSGTMRSSKFNGSVVYSTRVNLREAFGELKPGKWFAKFILREGRYQVQGHSEASELMGVVAFEVVAVSKDQANSANTPTEDVRISIASSDQNSYLTVIATVENKTQYPIAFVAYVSTLDDGTPGFKEPLSAFVSPDRFVPGGDNWVEISTGYCGTGRGSYRLEPNASTRLRISRDEEGSQFMRYRLKYDSLRGGNHESGVAISDVVEWPAKRYAANGN